MANIEQLEILKQGVDVWNKWRENNPHANIDFSDADRSGIMDFTNADLQNANLSGANISGTYLLRTNLSKANLRSANLNGTGCEQVKFIGANLHYASLSNTGVNNSTFFEADLSDANLTEAHGKNVDFSHADLTSVIFNHASLGYSNFYQARLIGTQLVNAELEGSDFSNALFDHANLGNLHLNETIGLDNVQHAGPSTIGIDTIALSMGQIPETFLRGCGLSDWAIESAKLYKPGISNEEINSIIYKIFDLRAHQAIQISPLFISYSHADTTFVEKLEPQLTNLGIRFWRDTHNATSGRLEKQIDQAMHQYPTVILILSENSIASDWVEHEARLARELEKEIGRDVLCPIALDDSWKTAKWPTRLMEQIAEYNILDFSKWNNDQVFNQVFSKMISGLDMFYRSDAESLNS